ncbi:MAG: AAA family ATPase [Vicingaceae bacterium]|nr:AAA family ATPase [Vicingaceae bacterium]
MIEEKVEIKLQKAYSIRDIETKKFQSIRLADDFQKLIGKPELCGSWIIFGDSGNGKTRFALELAKSLARFKKVAYNSLEEGISLSLSKAIKEINFSKVQGNFQLLQQESIQQLEERLKRQRSPQVVIIDSLQFSGLDKLSYKALTKRYAKKLFIFISHAEGKLPQGSTAKAVRYDSNVKVFVKGYKAFAVSRYGGGTPYIIWHDGAEKYWNKPEK